MIKDFLKYQAQTTPNPLGIEVEYAKGSYIYAKSGKKYLDFVAGVSACSLGHCHPKVVAAITEQAQKYLHVMVYGEFAQQPAIDFSKLLAQHIEVPKATTYLVNSGTEAIEGALKLARRYTGRKEIIAAKTAYHGNTMGSLSLMTKTEQKIPFEPLIPEINHLEFNNEASLDLITEKTAGVILESIQGGAGFIEPKNNFLQKVKQKCEKVGALLILDEIQPGFGRTGFLFGYQKYNVVPDVLVIGKGMAGGLPAGAFVAENKVINSLSDNPKMGHITTFGGNAVIAAAALATLKEVTETNLIAQTLEKEKLFRKLLQHPLIEEIRGSGLMLALICKSENISNQLILRAKEEGLVLFWLLFEKKAVRITPPLTIKHEEIREGCEIILSLLDEITTTVN
ncbi:aspartate aminotransferase family protein [Mesonia sp. K7]|uniref:aspartate aminotransferase family protein n=1 Tax=Mesonia sp. K7 TaxID=2218606 RepID=UPI000DA84C4E|nr:aminotransferase class III-fold pyridoxal phosphate-dependent enzyme [Mesonia sp. K7]PZD79462.1 aspartate aminotransferase family protein [Mesonia sp. K7]